MRVLITGAAGFIGSHLADYYVRAGGDVFGIDNLLTGDWANFPTEEAKYVTIDVTRRHDLYEFSNIAEPDVIFHCAASYSDPDKWHRDAEANVLGSINAALAATYHRSKLVYFNTALPPISSYAISKIAGQQYIQLAQEDALICRLANVYGPRNISGPIPVFYKRLMASESCTVVRTRREMFYIDDLVKAVVGLVELDHGGIIDICTGKPNTIREVFDAVAAALHTDAVPKEIDPASDDVVEMDLDPEQIYSFGWKPQTTLKKGVAATVAWYARHDPDNTYTHLRIQ
jgi:UDP-glucose 4-epimerase